jgi:hypothetical protein
LVKVQKAVIERGIFVDADCGQCSIQEELLKTPKIGL